MPTLAAVVRPDEVADVDVDVLVEEVDVEEPVDDREVVVERTSSV